MKYFTLEELTRTNTGLNNKPNDEQQANLIFLADNLLDKAREKLGSPIKVTSGFRSLTVNKKVGGAYNSQHTKGEAVDLVCNNNAKLFQILSKMNFDQLIWEKGTDRQPAWIHVSLKRNGINRGQILHIK
jgi:zinc D-Ala-D-Ala carboxypeptidase